MMASATRATGFTVGCNSSKLPSSVAEREKEFTPGYSQTFVLYRPGSYLIRLEVEGKDGTRVTSSYTKVEVLRVQ